MRLPKTILWLALMVAWVVGHALLFKDRLMNRQVEAELSAPKGAVPVFK